MNSMSLSDAFPASRKVYLGGVLMREISLTNGKTLHMYDTSGPVPDGQCRNVREGLPRLREPWVAPRRGTRCVTQTA